MNKLIKIAFVAVFAAVAGYGVYTSQKAETMSELALANVEALADDENPGSHNHGPTVNPFLGKKYCKNENQINCAY